MRVINSALHLANVHSIKNIRLLWSANSVLQASFIDLFRPIETVQLIRFHFLLFYCILKEKLFKTSVLRQPALFSGYRYFNDINIQGLQFNKAYWTSCGTNLIFNTCFDFYTTTTENNYYHLFKPQPYLQHRIDAISKLFKGQVAGVHIRRTDHEASKENSSTHLFMAQLDKMFLTGSIEMIYLSTDDLQTETELRERYPANIISIPNKVLDRNTKKGIEDALVDMYCLSNTHFILGSYQSTFSEVAAAIGNLPLIIVRS